MASFRQVSLSRRAVLRAALAGYGAALALSASGLPRNLTPVSPHDRVVAPASLEVRPGAIARYTARTKRKGFVGLAAIQAEYRDAIAQFPLSLPHGWSFPSESGLRDFEPETQWESGSGDAEAYFFWQRAVATEAYSAHLRGDSDLADEFLEMLAAGYDTHVRRMVLEDPGDSFVIGPIQMARSTSDVSRSGSGRAENFEALKALVIG